VTESPVAEQPGEPAAGPELFTGPEGHAARHADLPSREDTVKRDSIRMHEYQMYQVKLGG
jgi:hypothetical protein